MKKIILESKIEELGRAEQITGSIANQLNLSEDMKNNLAIAVTEAVGNAIKHGNKNDPAKKVALLIEYDKEKVIVRVSDEGKGFNPKELSDPLDPKNMFKESGRGIFILKSLMNNVVYDFSDTGTTLRFEIKIDQEHK